MAVDYLLIGQRLKDARKKCNYTQEYVAEKLNLSIAYISRVERGDSHVNLKRLSEFCNLLKTTEGEILNGVSQSNSNYLSNEFSDILSKCSPEKQKLIYKIAKTIAEEK